MDLSSGNWEIMTPMMKGWFRDTCLKFREEQLPKGNLLYVSGSSNRGSVSTLERWDGEKDEREVQEGRDICTPMTDSC